jgi:hypothetical protein
MAPFFDKMRGVARAIKPQMSVTADLTFGDVNMLGVALGAYSHIIKQARMGRAAWCRRVNGHLAPFQKVFDGFDGYLHFGVSGVINPVQIFQKSFKCMLKSSQCVYRFQVY